METRDLIEEAKKILGEFPLSDEYSSAGSVSAALVTKKGNVYTGICIDVSSSIGFCAEHSAIAEMLKNRETEISMIVAVGDKGIYPPCGRCRELMYQINNENIHTMVVIGPDKTVTLEELLPYRWQDDDTNPEPGSE